MAVREALVTDLWGAGGRSSDGSSLRRPVISSPGILLQKALKNPNCSGCTTILPDAGNKTARPLPKCGSIMAPTSRLDLENRAHRLHGPSHGSKNAHGSGLARAGIMLGGQRNSLPASEGGRFFPDQPAQQNIARQGSQTTRIVLQVQRRQRGPLAPPIPYPAGAKLPTFRLRY